MPDQGSSDAADVASTFPPIIGTTCELQTRSRAMFRDSEGDRATYVRMKARFFCLQDTARVSWCSNW